jgi:hypothetical protein
MLIPGSLPFLLTCNQQTYMLQRSDMVITVTSMWTMIVSFVATFRLRILQCSQVMNLSHVITEFSFGPYFPDIAQPLDYSFEIAKERKSCSFILHIRTHQPTAFMAYQYFLHVVPTTYIAPRSPPLETNQYSVTHYTRKLEHFQGTPGIFFKFDLDPMVITIHQRTTSLVQFIIR